MTGELYRGKEAKRKFKLKGNTRRQRIPSIGKGRRLPKTPPGVHAGMTQGDISLVPPPLDTRMAKDKSEPGDLLQVLLSKG